MRSLRIPLVAALAASAALSAAGTFTIRLVPFPTAEVADGHSQVMVSAQVFEDGHAAPDGTQVVFETNLGAFRETVVRTTNGWARATLVTGGVPGTARIKASVPQGDAVGSTCEVEFVKTREDLNAARETIEATSTGSLIFANDKRVIEGVAPEGGVVVRYRDLEIHADVLQIDLNSYQLKARKAVVKRGRSIKRYESLTLDLSSRTGFALANYPTTRPETLVAIPGGIAFVEPDANGETIVAQTRMKFGMVQVGRDGDVPVTTPMDDDPFALEDLSASPSTVGSRKAVVYARREIQFHRADIYVDNAKLLKFPLFVVNLNSSSGSPLVTDDLVSVNDNQIALNYPHYLSLKPGLTSLLRFRTGQRYGQNLTASRGAFLDYELSWSKGDSMQGGLTVGGLGRSDWVASLRQYWHLDGRSTASFQVDSPSGRSIGGSGSVNRSFGSYNLSLSGTQSATLNGPRESRYSSQNYGLTFDRNPQKVSHLPVRFSYGLTSSQTSSSFYTADASSPNRLKYVTNTIAGTGFAARLFSDSITLDRSSSINGSFGATQLYGPNARANGGLALAGSLSLTRRLGPGASAFVTYNYLQDGLNERITGRHSLSLIGNYAQGNTGLRLSASQGIGVERMSLSGEFSYRMSNLWRLTYSHFMNRYGVGGVSNSFTEYFFILGYRIGWREVGLTWSSRTRRPGIQLMNVNF